jgi:diguanylate cyclase (GGDEF)-like protein
MERISAIVGRDAAKDEVTA